jgi:hypothetical protein
MGSEGRVISVDYEVAVSESGEYIVINIHQPMTVDIAKRCGPEAMKLAAERKTDRYLFDVRGAANAATVTDNFYFAHDDILDFGFPKRSRSAFLVDEGDTSHDFITTAFLNEGYTVKLFHDETSAREWLMNDALA